jgi:hypothetical protein
MRVSRTLLVAVTLAGSIPTSAQDAGPDPTVAPAAPPPVNVARLPINLSRLQRRLQTSSESASGDGLRLKYLVDVFAPAPPIQLFTKEDILFGGSAPYGAPTNQQMLQALTPRGLTAPPTGRIQRRSKKR